MTKIRKVKRRQKYKVNVNRKRLRNKLRKKPSIQCEQIKNAWEDSKSVRRNLSQMGLAYDANKLFKVPSNKNQLVKTIKSQSSDSNDPEEEEEERSSSKKPKLDKKSKKNVAMELEAEARAPRERKFRLPQNQVNFLTYLMDKYGEDYEAMARDKKNYYQLTWKQIRRQVNVFKGVPEQYAEYLVKKGEIVLEDPEPLEVTKKKIREENFKKFNLPQPGSKRQLRKIKKTRGWIEEDTRRAEEIDSPDGDQVLGDADALEDLDLGGKNGRNKKLQLFSDDEEEAEKEKNQKKKKDGRESMSDSDSAGELEDDQDGEFVNLSDVSEEELSDDGIAGEFSDDSDSD